MATHRGIRIHQVPRRLVGESHIPPGLSPAYSGASEGVQRTGLAGEPRQIRAGTQTNFRFCRLPVRPQSRSGPTDTGPVAESTGQSTGNIVPKGLSGSAVHVVDRFTNGHRKTGSPRSFTHETYTMAPQKQLADTGIAGKSDSYSHLPPPSFAMVAERRQRSHRPALTPHKACATDLYRRIKRRVGRSLKQTHCKGLVVSARKEAAYKLSGAKGSPFSPKRVPRPLHRPDRLGGN